MTIEHRHRTFIQARSNPFHAFFCLLYVSIIYPLEVLASGENLVVHKTLVNPPSSSKATLDSQANRFWESFILSKRPNIDFKPCSKHFPVIPSGQTTYNFYPNSKLSDIFLFTH